MKSSPLVRWTSSGLYCEAGGFHIDPPRPVARAVITHAHADHLAKKSAAYLTTVDGAALARCRLDPGARLETLDYHTPLTIGGVTVSFHPAGHILGSAQVRIEHRGEVWCITGDYKTTAERTSRAFEPVPCQTLVTESTFAHPDFRWPDPAGVFDELHTWWRANQAEGRASFVYVYALGKAQRVLAGLDESAGPIAVHPEIETLNTLYREAGIDLPETRSLRDPRLAADWGQTLFLFTPSARWKQPCPFAGHYATAFVSGWMLQSGEAEKRRVQRGFVISDHADHAEIHATIEATGAKRIGVMHGYVDEFVAELQAAGRDAFAVVPPTLGAAVQRTLL